MGRSPHLNALEGMRIAIRKANKVNPHMVTVKTFPILLALYNASSEGKVLTRTDLTNRLIAMGNYDGRAAIWVTQWRMRENGYISWEEKSYGARVSLTVSGVNYVRAVERAIRRIRWNTL